MSSPPEQPGPRAAPDWFAGGGEMGALMRSVDWARTPLGPVESWPQSLRTTVSLCLASRLPILVGWGPELVLLYNDACRAILGATGHPQAMGRAGREVWSENGPDIWSIVGPLLEAVRTHGEATSSDDQLLRLDRNGFPEECSFTFSCSPLRDESGGVGGVFCAVTETPRRVLAERRPQTTTAEEALRITEERLRLALSGARAGVWEWNLLTQEVTWSPELYDLLGLERYSVEPSGGRFMEVIHPDDRERTVALITEATERGGHFAFEFRALRADGTEIWISTFGRVEQDPEGKPTQAIGINQDITERKRAELHAHFLLELDAALAPLEDADEIEQVAADRLGTYLDADHCYFSQITGKRVAILREYRRGEISVLGDYDLDDFLTLEARERMMQGGAIVVDDVMTSAYTAASAESYAALAIAAFLAVPVKYHDRWVGAINCLSRAPRAWRADELRLMQDLAVHVWPLIEQARAARALREADQRKDEFLAMLAHELRNPLAPIRNAAEVLKLVGPTDTNQQWAREVIERQTQHLTRLVDDLLDVSRITQGRVTLTCEPLELATVIQRAVEASRPLIDARRHQLTVALPSEPVRFEGDLTRLVQVVSNLLNNAAKYTDEGGAIHLEAAQEGTEAVIRVRDNGMGVPADLLPHVFDLFTQADRSLDRSQGGLGIGLTLVRQLVRLHGGRVEARSDGPGRGSEFIVRLPAEAAPATPEAEESARESARPAAPTLKILLVEDSVDAAEMMSFILHLSGHEVRIAHDGRAALTAAHAFQPEVVLCDIGLPGMNGYEVAARLREQPAFQHTPLIALTGYGQEEARQRSKEAGFNYHLVKPVEPDTLKALLDKLRVDGSKR